MQSASDTGFIRSVVVPEFPGMLTVEGFENEYSRYVEHHESQRISSLVPTILLVVSLLMMIVGGLTSVFGPSTISYSMSSGPTFAQFIQMYPGPIFTVGSLLLMASQYLMSWSGAAREPDSFLLSSYTLELPAETDYSLGLSVIYLGGDVFSLGYKPPETAEAS
jgi:hypothetical protein